MYSSMAMLLNHVNEVIPLPAIFYTNESYNARAYLGLLGLIIWTAFQLIMVSLPTPKVLVISNTSPPLKVLSK